MKVNKKIIYVVMFLCILVFVCIPAFRLFDHFKVNDLDFHIKRVDGLVQAINNFNFPYRINSVGNSGYGSAEPIMYPYGTIYLLGLLYKVFGDYNLTFNAFYILINVFTAMIMYYSTYEIFYNKNIAIMATIMELFSFYRVWEIYVGACVGQYVAIVFLPLVAEGYINVLRGKYSKWFDVFVGFSMIFQSHIITAFYTGILLVVLTLIFIKNILSDKKKVFAIIKIVLIFVLINLWYIVPFVQYYFSSKIITPHIGFPWKQVSKLSIEDHIILTYKIILNNLCFNIFDEAKIHMKISYMGVFLILFVFIFCVVKIVLNKRKSKNYRHVFTFEDKITVVFLLIFVFNLLVSSGIFTRTFFGKFNILQKFFAIQQFEHREIVRGEVLFYMASAYIVEKYIKNKLIIKSVICVLGIVSLIGLYTVIFSSSKIYDNCYNFVNSDYMLKGTVDGDIRDKIKLEYKYVLPKNIFDGKVRLDNDGIVVKNVKKGYLSYNLDYEILDNNEHTVLVPLFNYEGYQAIDGMKNIKIKTGDNALISVKLKNSKGKLKIMFKEKFEWIVCDIISLMALIMLFIKGIIYVRNKNK